MDSVKIDITGDRQVGLRFDQFPDVLYDDLRVEVDSLSTELFALIEAATPSRLGALRGQERLRLFTDKTRITGYVDVAGAPGSQDFAKAGALEYGTRGKSNKVVSHSMRLDHFWADKLKDPITVVTKAFDRTPNIEEHAFERGPLEAMAPQILSRLNAVVAAAVAEGEQVSTDFETPVAALFAHMIAAATIAFTADATADSAILENVSTLAGMFPGLPVFGAGAAEGATILEIDEEAATVTLSDALTQDGSVVDFEIGFQTTSRRVAHWGSVPEQPAFFLRRVGVTDHVDHENFYVMTTLECEAWVYSKAGQNPDIAPDTALTALERMLRESFAPDGDYGDPRFTLAGTVHWCRFEGKSDISPGDQGGQGDRPTTDPHHASLKDPAMTTADIVNTWFRERIACAAIARDTPAYNQAFGALPDLIARLDPPVVVTPPSGKTIAPEGDEHSA